jgi:hypothetical protein
MRRNNWPGANIARHEGSAVTRPEIESLSTVSSPAELCAAMRQVPGWARGKVRWVCSWLPGAPRVGWDEARLALTGPKSMASGLESKKQ